MDTYRPPTLDLERAYIAAYHWLAQAVETPKVISEPVDGVVELICDDLVSRVRWSRIALNQGAILALLRALDEAKDPEHPRPHAALFSVTGFTPGALAVAESQDVALFDIGADGTVIPVSPAARALQPAVPPVPAFAERTVTEPDEPDAPRLVMPETNPDDWRDCPTCGATHHHKANFCASCGNDLTAAGPAALGTPVPPPAPGGPTLRCRTCGSHDIELIR